MPAFRPQFSLPKTAAFLLLSCAATCFPMFLGRWLWPVGLDAGTETVFWPATALHVAGLMRLGPAFWPVPFLGTLAGQLFLDRPIMFSLVNAAGNAAEAFAVAWTLRRLCPGAAVFTLQTVRGVLVFIGLALFAPLASALPGAATLVSNRWIPGSEYWPAVGVWCAANASSILLLTPALVFARRGQFRFRFWTWELCAWLVLGAACSWVAFFAVFRAAGGVNFAFLAFPFVIYAAARFSPATTAAGLAVVMGTIYTAIIHDAPVIPADEVYRALWFIQSCVIVLGATGLLLAAITRERRRSDALARREQRRSLAASLGETRARLQSLTRQLNPHFLFNSLNSIRATLPLDAHTPRQMITDLADYLRLTLETRDRELVPVREEIEACRRYLAIEQHRRGDLLRVAFGIDPDVECAPVPFLVLQPIVENAIRHGFERTSGVFELEVRAARSGSDLRIEVSNTGRWRSTSGERSGIGLENVRRRLELLHGSAARLEISSRDNRVTVAVIIPLPAS